MKYGEITGVKKPVARVAQGTTMIGSDLDEAQSFALLDQVYELGCNTIDTAHVYCGGDSERILGRWIEARGLREQIVVITKGAAHSKDRRRLTPFDIASDLQDSLARLKTEYIDLYLLHRDDPDMTVEPIIDTLNRYLQTGKFHAFGASNWTHQRIEAANAYARASGQEPFVASSPQFSLVESLDEPWPLCISISGPAALRADPVRSMSILERIPAGRWGTPEDLKGPVVFLASSASDYLNGAILPVDGGWLAR